MHAVGLGPLPTFVLITVALASSLSVGGVRQLLLCTAGVAAGVLAYALFGGLNFAVTETIWIDIAPSVFTFVYFMPHVAAVPSVSA